MPFISIENLTFTHQFKREPSLRGVRLAIEKGEIMGITGPSAAGKTTLCLCLNSLIPSIIRGNFSGDVVVDGLNTKVTPTHVLAKKVGMVFDVPDYQLSQASVFDEIAFGLENLGFPREDIISRVEEALDFVRLSEYRSTSPFELSGGQQQRLSIACALALYPDVLVLDEPLSNLDPQGKAEVISTIKDVGQRKNMTIVLTENNVEILAEYADRIVVLNKGEVTRIGTPEEVFSEVQELNEGGVRVPQVTQLAYYLDTKYRCWHSKYPVTVETCYRGILDACFGGTGSK